ncbi:MAG: DegV family protein [Anaerolineae bacterium]|jgi:DegV family protein with EDD domain
MRQVGVVTDSTSDVPASLAASLGIEVVPCQVFFGQEALLDGLDLSPSAFYERLARSPELPRTSGPTVNSFAESYRRLLEEEAWQGVVSIHVAGNLSGTVNAAWAAAQSLPEPSRVEIVDSGQVSMGLGWAAVEAARLARRGGTAPEVGQAIRARLSQLRTAAMIDTLDNLYRGGRINQFSAILGTALQIKPLISLQGGELTVWAKVRTRSRALNALVDRVQSWGPLSDVAILHTGAEELAETFAGRLREFLPDQEMLMLAAGSALTTHLGLGAVGVCALLATDV